LAFHRLGTLPAAGAARPGEAAAAPLLPEGATLKQALMLMLEHGTDQLAMPGGGALHLSDILAAA
ncbi:ABC transporter ATP-binding protein, partial [Pseudoroseomonas wenyumeiae]